MAKLTRAERSAAARKGAKTKAYQANLASAISLKNMLDRGMTIHETALLTGQTVKDVLDALKLLTYVPVPPLQQIGVAAHGVGLGQDIVDTLNLTKKAGANLPNLSQSSAIPHVLQPFVKEVMTHPENVRGDIINTLNNIGKTVTQPVTSAEDFFRKLITGMP